MATIIQLRRGTAAQWTLANPILADGEFALEKDTLRIKVGDGTTVWNLLPYTYMLWSLSEASEVNKGIVEAANDAEMQAGTDIGGTGAMLFVRPSKLRVYRDIVETTASLAGSTLTCNCANKIESRHVYGTISSNTTIVFSNKTNSLLHSLVLAVTGTGIALTFESDTRMSRYNEVSSGVGWIQSTKVYTVTSFAAGDLHEFSLLKTGSVYILKYDGPVRP